MSLSLPAPGVSAAAMLQGARGQERFFWHRAHDTTVVAGFGVAVELMAWGAGRYQDIEDQARALFGEALLLGSGSPLAAPRLFGGFAFQDDFAPDNTWAVFHPAHFFIPHFQLVQTKQESWLAINAVLPPGEEQAGLDLQLRQALEARYRLLLQAGAGVSLARSARGMIELRYPMTYDAWAEMLDAAIGEMKRTPLEKVVLSRVAEIRSRQPVDVLPALEFLNTHYLDCTRFLFEPRAQHAFYGATPELLVRLRGREILTTALAGSRSRGRTSVEDALLAQALLSSPKDRQEHQLVVESVRRRLAPLVQRLEVPAEPQVHTLSYIHHLLTPIRGTLREALGILPLVERLHPTPALGGSPRELALDFIRRREPVPRGWYAAPLGWIDMQMDGEFVVAIRSAVAQQRRVWLYAGAGILANSDPQSEWAETALKFRPMLQALGLEEFVASMSQETH